MDPRDKLVSSKFVAFVNETLKQNAFFSDLRLGNVDLETVQKVFEQYYLWRNQFHRWFGVCIVKSPAFGTDFDTDFILSELIEHVEQEISGDHHGKCVTFLKSIGVTNPRSIQPLRVTTAYSDSFIMRYMHPSRSGEEALAALAGREIVAPARNRLIVEALSQHYDATAGLEFFELHEALEIEHFQKLWGALVKGYSADENHLIEAARYEIEAHVAFWDDTYAAVGQTGRVRRRA